MDESLCRIVTSFHARQHVDQEAAKFLAEDESTREITVRSHVHRRSLFRSHLVPVVYAHWTGQPDSNYNSLVLRDREKTSYEKHAARKRASILEKPC